MHAYLSALSFRVAIKVIMLLIKWELFFKCFTWGSDTCFTIMPVVSFLKCFLTLEMRKYGCRDVYGSLCLVQNLKPKSVLREYYYLV